MEKAPCNHCHSWGSNIRPVLLNGPLEKKIGPLEKKLIEWRDIIQKESELTWNNVSIKSQQPNHFTICCKRCDTHVCINLLV